MAWTRKPVQQVVEQPKQPVKMTQEIEEFQEVEAEEEVQPVRKVVKQVAQVKNELIVVKELPTQAIRKVQLDDGSVADLITTEEALARILKRLEE